jgi:hypothetical protein
MGEVLDEDRSLFSLQRENLLQASRHLERENNHDLAFGSHHQEWLRPDVRVTAIFLSPTERKFTIAIRKAFHKQGTGIIMWETFNEPIEDVESSFLCSLSCQTQDKEQRTEFVVPCLDSSLNPDTIRSRIEIDF